MDAVSTLIDQFMTQAGPTVGPTVLGIGLVSLLFLSLALLAMNRAVNAMEEARFARRQAERTLEHVNGVLKTFDGRGSSTFSAPSAPLLKAEPAQLTAAAPGAIRPVPAQAASFRRDAGRPIGHRDLASRDRASLGRPTRRKTAASKKRWPVNPLHQAIERHSA